MRHDSSFGCIAKLTIKIPKKKKITKPLYLFYSSIYSLKIIKYKVYLVDQEVKWSTHVINWNQLLAFDVLILYWMYSKFDNFWCICNAFVME